jgi:hypothetical protein
MEHEHIYIGIWRYDGWSVCLIEELTEDQLLDVDVLRHVRTTVSTDDIGPSGAARRLGREARDGVHPHQALQMQGHACQGLELLREHVRRARSQQARHG